MNTKDLVKKYPLLQSSANPENLSATIKGILLAIVTVLSAIGVIPADALKEVSPLTDVIVTGIQGFLGGIAAVLTVYGALRKLYYQWFSK